MRQIIEFIINIGIYTAKALKSFSSAIISAYYAFLDAIRWLILNISDLIDFWIRLFD